EGTQLTVTLPNESIRATVTRVVNKNVVEAALDLAYPFTRIHGYNFGDVLRFRRFGDILGEQWRVLDPPRPLAKPDFDNGPQPVTAAPDERAPDPPRLRPKEKAQRRSDAAREGTT